MGKSDIKYLTLSQEDLVNAGAFDLKLAIQALKGGLYTIGRTSEKIL